MKSLGKVYLVGVGPGDPGLLTLRARDVLSKAEVVIYDALIHPRILELIPPGAQKIFRGHRVHQGALTQSQINRLLVKLARRGKNVVRLKGGDPFVFGRGAEEALELASHGIPFEVIPGVTAAVAVPAYAGIPVTHRMMNSSFTVVTGHEDPSKSTARIDWKSLAENNGTIVFLMGLHTLPSLCQRLIRDGKDPETPAAVVQSGTTAGQRVVRGTLRTIARLTQKAGLRPPSTVVVGKVVTLMDRLQWLKNKPLYGIRVLVTRGRGQTHQLSDLLAEKGAEVLEIPTIEIAPLPMGKAVKKRIRAVPNYDWLVFSSVNAVQILMGYLFKMKMDVRDLSHVKVACVGEATAAALAGSGIKADLVPKDYKQEGLVRAFAKIPVNGKKVLLAGAKEGRDVLWKFLEKRGAAVDPLPLYQNRIPPGAKQGLRRLFEQEGGVDIVTFASSSAVDHFFGLFSPSQRRKWLSGIAVAVIGPITAASAEKWGTHAAIQPRKYIIPALVEALVKWTGQRKLFL